MKASKKQPCNTCEFTGNCPNENNIGREFTSKLFNIDCWTPKPENRADETYPDPKGHLFNPAWENRS